MIISRAKRWINDHPGRAGTLAGWYQQGASGVAALLVVPLIVRTLSLTDAGLWFSFQSLLAIINLTDFGLSFVLARQISYSLHARTDVEPMFQDLVETRQGWLGVSDVYQLGRRVFWYASLIAVMILLVLYHLILPLGKLLSNASDQAPMAWYILGGATVLALQAKPHFALIEGVGRVYVTRFVTGTCQLLTGIGIIAVALFGGGLAAMASTVAVVSLLQYAAARYLVRSVTNRMSKAGTPPTGLLTKLLAIAWPMGILNFSAFLFSSVQVPLLGFLLGPKAVPGFFLAQRIGQVLNQAVMQLVSPQLPLHTQSLAKGQCFVARKRMQRLILMVTGSALAANAFFLFASPAIVNVWVGPNQYVNFSTLQLLSIDYLLLTTSVVWAQFVLASGSNPFVWTTLLAGILNVVFCALLAHLGTKGIALASLLSGLCTNYWFTTWKGVQMYFNLKRKSREPVLSFSQT
jgi:O-antigen/teichoic acid export membrane protein